MQNTTKEELKEKWNTDLKIPGVWNSPLITPKEFGGIHYEILDKNKVLDWWLDKIDLILKEKAERIVKAIEGEKKEDYSSKDIEDRLQIFTLTPHNDESMKEFVKTIADMSSRLGSNKALDLAIKIVND